MDSRKQQHSLGDGTTPDRQRPWLQQALAVAVLALLGGLALNYPGPPLVVYPVLLAFLLLTFLHPLTWLVALPALLPVFNLAPWSGRFFLEEWDLLVLATVATSLWHGLYFGPRTLRTSGTGRLILGLFFLATGWSVLVGLLPLAETDHNALSSYLSSYNALRVGRGLLWGFLLLPPLFSALSADAPRARSWFAWGMALGLLGTGLAVVWERGFLADLTTGGNIYRMLDGLLNLSANYRATALFSEMHMGGEAIDGYLVLALPFAAVGLFDRRSRAFPYVAGMALALGLYATMATFSRGTYMATGVIAMVLALSALRRLPPGEAARGLGLLAIMVGGMGLVTSQLFQRGGLMALFLTILTWALGVIMGFLHARFPRRNLAMAGMAILVATTGLLVRFQLTSKWAQNSLPEAAGVAVVGAVVALGLGFGAGRAVAGRISLRVLGLATTLLAVVMGISVEFMFGALMKARVSEVSKDYDTRLEHWRDAIGMMDEGLATPLFGMGFGSFPRTYLYNRTDDEGGTYSFVDDAGDIHLRLSGGKDMRIGQRVSLDQGQRYRVLFDFRTSAPEARLKVRICRRNILEMLEYNSNCRDTQATIGANGGAWQHFEHAFDLGELGDSPWRFGRRPLTLEIMNIREFELSNKPAALVDVDNIRVLDPGGQDAIRNGDFARGMDEWFPYNDFNHMPWHIKNLWVDIYFEQGLLGVFCFLGVLLYFLRRALPRSVADDFALASLAAVAGFLTVGLVGTLMDVPRIMTLFVLIVLFQFPSREVDSIRNRPRSFVKRSREGASAPVPRNP